MFEIGIHLPQFGRASGPDSIARAARLAEERGYAGLWVSDHIVQPVAQGYPSAYLFDPLVTLTWAAALTSTIGLGTSVLVVPQRHPLELANSLASLDRLSGGRLTVGVGAGWSAGEFEALGQRFDNRGERLDEALRLWRRVWGEDPVSFDGQFSSFEDIKVQPKPAHEIAIWVGGGSPRARRRAIEYGDGFQLIGLAPDEVTEPIAHLREARPEAEFRISLRTGWDPNGMDHRRIIEEREAYEAAGIDYVVAAPWRSDPESWLHSMETLADLMELPARPG